MSADWALSSYFGKLWASKILESDRAKYNSELEGLRNVFNKELEYYKNQLELNKAALSRYSEYQFHLYNELWQHLCDLRFSGDKLWDEANVGNLKDFSQQLFTTKNHVIKSSLLIEDDHYTQLLAVLDIFANYQIGKQKLIEIRLQDAPSHAVFQQVLQQQGSILGDNRLKKMEYDSLLDLLKKSFKNQLRDSNEQTKI